MYRFDVQFCCQFTRNDLAKLALKMGRLDVRFVVNLLGAV